MGRRLYRKYYLINIKKYELDKIVWNDDNGNIKRTDKEIIKLFDEIHNNESWIIEDVGKSKFIKGREQTDIIYYIISFKIIFKSY